MYKRQDLPYQFISALDGNKGAGRLAQNFFKTVGVFPGISGIGEKALSKAEIAGANLYLNKFLNLEKTDLTFGASYIGRYQNNSTNDLIPANVKSLGARVNLYSGRFSLNLEGIIKDSDVIANEGVILSDKLYDGTALQLDLGYSKKGLGLNTTFRRLENFNF